MRIHNLIDSPIFHTFFLFWWSFILFSQSIILSKVCVLKIFLTQFFRWSHYFFKEDLSFEEILLIQSFYVQLSFPFPSLTFSSLPSFFVISLTTKQDISFQIQLIKKKCLEDINKNNPNLVRIWCKIHTLYHPIRDYHISFLLKTQYIIPQWITS